MLNAARGPAEGDLANVWRVTAPSIVLASTVDFESSRSRSRRQGDKIVVRIGGSATMGHEMAVSIA